MTKGRIKQSIVYWCFSTAVEQEPKAAIGRAQSWQAS